jgi:hypothetical protein
MAHTAWLAWHRGQSDQPSGAAQNLSTGAGTQTRRDVVGGEPTAVDR